MMKYSEYKKEKRNERKINEIIWDELNGRLQSYSQQDLNFKNSNRQLITALRLMNLLKIADFNKTIELAKYINDVDVDLEMDDKTATLIEEKVIDIMKHKGESFF